jgi:hypothetical protein
MGHIGVKRLKHAVEGLLFDEDSTGTCEICTRANVKRQPFPQVSDRRATRLLERIHGDICGPLVTRHNSYRYFLLLIDEHSSGTTVYCLTRRSDTLDKFKHYKATVETLHGAKICFFRIDNAPEFIEGEMRKFCDGAGIIYERTVPDAPQQNGKTERHNYTFQCMG